MERTTIPGVSFNSMEEAMDSRSHSPVLKVGFLLVLAAGFGLQQQFPRSASAADPADNAAGLPISEVQNPERALTAAIIKNRQGEDIGKVSGVTRGTDGRIKTVQVELGGAAHAGIVALDAGNLVYLPEPNVILTSLTREQVDLMPRLGEKS